MWWEAYRAECRKSELISSTKLITRDMCGTFSGLLLLKCPAVSTFRKDSYVTQALAHMLGRVSDWAVQRLLAPSLLPRPWRSWSRVLGVRRGSSVRRWDSGTSPWMKQLCISLHSVHCSRVGVWIIYTSLPSDMDTRGGSIQVAHPVYLEEKGWRRLCEKQ